MGWFFWVWYWCRFSGSGGSAFHDFYLGPRAARLLKADDPGAESMRRVASYAGRVTLLLSLIILALAVLLVRGW